MLPSINHPSLNLISLDEAFIVYKISTDAKLSADILATLARSDANDAQFISVTRTSEVSLVCSASSQSDVGIDAARWKCIKIKGPMDFGLTGTLCDFSAPSKRAGISIFAISTWNTDYIFVPEACGDGWKFEIRVRPMRNHNLLEGIEALL